MAIWQFRLTFVPETVLLGKYEILPSTIPMEFAEGHKWSNVQPPFGFEREIDMLLPRMDSWSTSMRMWGQKHGDDACVIYVDENQKTVEEISFRVDARAISPDLVRHICVLAKQLGCVLMTADYDILLPDESMVLSAINHSTAKKFVDDPVSTLQGLDHEKIKKRADYFAKDLKRKTE
jgi:hypothetical protein